MKKCCALVFLIAAVGFAGCASQKTRKVDAKSINWSQQIGTYTYEQARAELGKPVLLTESDSGKTAEWVLQRSPRMSLGLGVGGGSIGSRSGVGVGVGTDVTPPPHGENLRLKFNETGTLTEWSKVSY